MKMGNAELNLKGATLFTVCSKIARTSVKVRQAKQKLLQLVLLQPQRRISRTSFEVTTRGFTSLRWPENERYSGRNQLMTIDGN